MLEIQEEVLFKTTQNSQTPPNTQIEILKKYFPNCFDKAGSFLTHQLEDILKNAHTDVSKEYYSLNWLGKSYAKLLRDLPTETLLAPDDIHNKQPKNKDSNNILISGDNLDVLKHLKNAYAEKIKMIYIDPPYNTGTDGFVYNDKYNFKAEQLAELADINIDEAERILKFTQRESNSHSAWLTFMYPRLYIARTLLKDDGVIFISIDDNEVAQLRLLCDEIFGEENFVGQITLVNNPRGRDYGGIAKMHEYILAYKKNLDAELFLLKDQNKKFPFTDSISGFELRELRNRNIVFNKENRPNLYYPFYIDILTTLDNKLYKISLEKINDNFIELYPKKSQGIDTVWRWGKIKSSENLNINIAAKKMKDGGFQIVEKYRKNETMARSVWWDKEDNSEKGTLEVKDLFGGKKIFDFPKSKQVLIKLIEIGTSSNDLILDFFAGSGTTADAVMQLNAEDGGSRRFMLVQLPEQIDPKKSNAAYDFVKNDLGKEEPTIFDITKERIIRSAKKILTENGEYQGDLGFKVYTIIPNEIMYKNAYVSPQMELLPRTELTEDDYQALLTTWRLNDGEPLTQEVMIKDLVNYPAYLCGKNLYLLYPNFESNQIKALIERLDNDKDFMPNRIIFYGEQIVSSKQKELAQALASYVNKKGLDISLVARY